MLDEVIEIFFDIRSPRRSQHASISQSTRAELRWPLKPSNDLAAEKELHCLIHLTVAHHLEGETRLAIVEHVFDFVARVAWSPIRCRPVWLSRHVLLVMLYVERSPEGCSGIPGRGRHEQMIEPNNLFERSHQQAVIEQSAAEANVVDTVLSPERINHFADLLRARLLHAGRKRPTLLVSEFVRIFRKPRLLPELRRQNEAVTHPVIQIAVIQTHGSIAGLAQHVAEHFAICGFTSKAQPLRLVLLRMRNETEELGDSGVQPRQRVRVADVAQLAEPRPIADRDHAGSPVSIFVHGNDQGAFKRRKEESTGRMAHVVLNVRDSLFGAGLVPQHAQVAELPCQAPNLANLRMASRDWVERRNPRASRRTAHPSPHRSRRERDAVHTLPSRSRFRQTELHRCGGQPASVFLARKLALLDDGANYAIFEQGGRGVMTER